MLRPRTIGGNVILQAARARWLPVRSSRLQILNDGTVTISGAVKMTGLPTADPTVAGQLWNDAGTVKVSAG
jgi:hypothetical protein